MRQPERSARPSPELQLLLRAALGDAKPAAAAWAEWCARVDFDDMGEASMRLMPLVSANLAGHGIEHPLTGRLRGIHRYWWSRNQRLFHRLTKELDVFAAHSIDVMVLKGVPLALGYYGDPGLRPMSDFDVLVPTPDADRALALLLGAGWKATQPIPIKKPSRQIDTGVRPGIGLADVENQFCDLHWHMLHDCCFEGADAPFWRRSETMALHDRSFKVPDTTDLLLHICAHGAVYNAMPPVRWIADAAMILRTAADRVSWDRLLADAEERLLVVVLREAMRLLVELTDAPVPGAVMARLTRARSSKLEEREYRLRLVDSGYLRTLTGRRCQLIRQYRDASALERLTKLPEFMQRIWSLPTKRAIAGIFFFHVLPAYVRRVTTGEVVDGHSQTVAE
jgi:hypothetical protein